METTWPRSSSPCSGVLKFRLASNASANVASAVSLDWVMGLLDTFREVDPGPRDRLDGGSYSKANPPAPRPGQRGGGRGVGCISSPANRLTLLKKKPPKAPCATRTANL